MKKKCAVSTTVGVLLSMALSACSAPKETEVTAGVIDPSTASRISGPTSSQGFPDESPRLTVRLIGEGRLDNIEVSLVNKHDEKVASAVSNHGVVFMPLKNININEGEYRLWVGKDRQYDVNSSSVSIRDVVSSSNDTVASAENIVSHITAEEAALLFGVGPQGGINREATHHIPSDLVYQFSLYEGQVLNILEGVGVESGTIKITDMHYVIDGDSTDEDRMTIQTKKANPLDVVNHVVGDSSHEEPPKIPVGADEIIPEDVPSKAEEEKIEFTVDGSKPVISITADVSKKKGY